MEGVTGEEVHELYSPPSGAGSSSFRPPTLLGAAQPQAAAPSPAMPRCSPRADPVPFSRRHVVHVIPPDAPVVTLDDLPLHGGTAPPAVALRVPRRRARVARRAPPCPPGTERVSAVAQVHSPDLARRVAIKRRLASARAGKDSPSGLTAQSLDPVGSRAGERKVQ